MRVVAAALYRDGCVLAAHRREPAGWEFPGGKVEPDETDSRAIVRECREELGIEVRAAREIGAVEHDAIVLRLWQVELLSGEPAAGADHDRLAWLLPGGLADLDWLPADRALLPVVFG